MPVSATATACTLAKVGPLRESQSKKDIEKPRGSTATFGHELGFEKLYLNTEELLKCKERILSTKGHFINRLVRAQGIPKRLRRRDEICPESPFVFFHETERAGAKIGDRVLDLKKSFKRACSQAGISDFRIHDLRHTFASWLVMDGVPLYDVSKLLRHSNIRMTEKCAHLAPDHL